MNTFEEYLQGIENEENREKLKTVLEWITNTYPSLDKKIAWKQPMFTNSETFIIGFSIAKNNFALSVEKYTLDLFREKIEKTGYETTQQLIKIKWNENVDYSLLKKLIDFNIEDKKGMKTFFRK